MAGALAIVLAFAVAVLLAGVVVVDIVGVQAQGSRRLGHPRLKYRENEDTKQPRAQERDRTTPKKRERARVTRDEARRPEDDHGEMKTGRGETKTAETNPPSPPYPTPAIMHRVAHGCEEGRAGIVQSGKART